MKALRLPGWGLLALGLLSACSGAPRSPEELAPPVEFTVPAGASLAQVADSLQARGLVTYRRLFLLFARLKGVDREIRAGEYALPLDASWARILEDMTEGRVLTETLTIPEGFTLKQMSERIATICLLPADSILAGLTGDSLDSRWGVSGPGLEGYLFPDSYRFARGSSLDEVIRAMVNRYQEVWTPERVARRDSLGMTEREILTLASIVQAEARQREEMPIIASVYHNRLRRGMLLQADPTVLYALGGPRPRLLYAAMDSVAEHPYNTYTQPGLPPGPIGAPGTDALDAALNPAPTDYLYFVAHPDGTHVFSRTLAEHNQAVAATRLEWDRLRREQAQEAGRES